MRGGLFAGFCGSPGIDPVDGWLTRVATNGGTVSGGTETAVRAFMTSARANGYASLLTRLNLQCGDYLAAQVPLIGTTNDTPVSMSGSDYSEALGFTTDGTAKYINTGFTPSSLTGGLGVYCRTTVTADGNTRCALGGRNSGTQVYKLEFNSGPSSGRNAGEWGGNTGMLTSFTGSNGAGFWHVSRTSSTALALYKNGTSISTFTTATTVATAGMPLFLMAYNINGTAGQWLASGARVAGYVVDAGLSSTLAALLYTDMQTFQTALSRNV